MDLRYGSCDICLSYAPEDEDRARPIATALEAQGWSVLCDYQTLIWDHRRDVAGCVVVLWSPASIESDWGFEAGWHANRRGVLVPVLLEDIDQPRSLHSFLATSLVAWDGESTSPKIRKLVENISVVIGRPPRGVASGTSHLTFSHRRGGTVRLRPRKMSFLSRVLRPSWKRLPKKCFISHAYNDDVIRDDLIRRLPGYVEPIVFPLIREIDPYHPFQTRRDPAVTPALVQAIRESDGLIYLTSPASTRSFWVAFECDYALRMGKPVFSADRFLMELSPHEGPPLDLAVLACFNSKDGKYDGPVWRIQRFLETERHIDLLVADDSMLRSLDAITTDLKETLKRGGCLLVFWSQNASSSTMIRRLVDITFTEELDSHVLFACLDHTPLPEFWPALHDKPVGQSPGKSLTVEVYGDEMRSAAQRIDDLVSDDNDQM